MSYGHAIFNNQTGFPYTEKVPIFLQQNKMKPTNQQSFSRRRLLQFGAQLVGTSSLTVWLGNRLAAANQSAQTGGFANIVSSQTYEAMFPNRNTLYSYDSLVRATQRYTTFCNEGSDIERKREAAAFLANIGHETTGGWPTAPGGPYAWGLYFVEEVGCESGLCTGYCDASNTTYQCVPDQTYHGRGPMQLSWNYNYGAAGQALGLNLLANPDLVKSDGAVAFSTALWFWMTPQPPKPSCHDVMSGTWTSSNDDLSKGRVPGFGMTINIINGGLECGQPTNNKVEDRVGFYNRFCEMLGVIPDDNVYCDSMQPY